MLEDLHPVGPALNYDQVCVRHAGLAITTAPERWSATWEHNLRLARLADEVGIDFMLPVARDRTAAWIRTPSSARSPRVLSGVDYVRTWADGFSSTC